MKILRKIEIAFAVLRGIPVVCNVHIFRPEGRPDTISFLVKGGYFCDNIISSFDGLDVDKRRYSLSNDTGESKKIDKNGYTLIEEDVVFPHVVRGS